MRRSIIAVAVVATVGIAGCNEPEAPSSGKPDDTTTGAEVMPPPARPGGLAPPNDPQLPFWSEPQHVP